MTDAGATRPLRGVRAGDTSDAFSDFVAARSPALRRTAWLLTGDIHRADDLVQEALATAWRHWRAIERMNQPEAYVRRVMVNASISGTRRRWRGEVPTEQLPEEPGGDVTAQADLRHALRTALATLPARQRAVVVLRFVDDLTEAQTAVLLGCSTGTVKSQASRALARLRDCPQLQGLGDPGQVQERLVGLTAPIASGPMPVQQVVTAARRQRRTAVLKGAVTAALLPVLAFLAGRPGETAPGGTSPGGTAPGGEGVPGGPLPAHVDGSWTAIGLAVVGVLLITTLVGLVRPRGTGGHRAARAAAFVAGVCGAWMAADLLFALAVQALQQQWSWVGFLHVATAPALAAVLLAGAAGAVLGAGPGAPRRRWLLPAADVVAMSGGISLGVVPLVVWSLATSPVRRGRTLLLLTRYNLSIATVCLLAAVLLCLAGGTGVRDAGRRVMVVATAAFAPVVITRALFGVGSHSHPTAPTLAVAAASTLAAVLVLLVVPAVDRRFDGRAVRAALVVSACAGPGAEILALAVRSGRSIPPDRRLALIVPLLLAVALARVADPLDGRDGR